MTQKDNNLMEDSVKAIIGNKKNTNRNHKL